jgi:hypothetical protein
MSDNFKNKLSVWAVYSAGGLIFGAFLTPLFGFKKALYIFLAYSLFSAISIFVFGKFPGRRNIFKKTDNMYIDDYFSENYNHGDGTDEFDEIIGLREKEICYYLFRFNFIFFNNLFPRLIRIDRIKA